MRHACTVAQRYTANRFEEAKKEAEKNVPKFGIIIPINPSTLLF